VVDGVERSFQIDESNVQVTALTKLSSFLNYEAKSRYLVDRWAVWHETDLLWPPAATDYWERATE